MAKFLSSLIVASPCSSTTNRQGLTYLEIIITTALVVILAASASSFFSQFIARTNADATVNIVVSTLRKAQTYSIGRKNDTPWGVCLYNNNVRLFTGSCNTPVINEDFSVSNTTTISGLNPVTFSLSTGEPSSQLTITVSNNLTTKIINLNPVGGITTN